MPTYHVDSAASRIVVTARSNVHDTSTTWDRFEGTVDTAPDTIESAGASGRFTVDMTSYDAGDWLKNRKLRKDLGVDEHPSAEFEIGAVRGVQRKADGTFEAVCDGLIRWRGKEVQVSIAGIGSVTDAAIEATGSFDLDIRDLGVKPPKILMFKIEEQVSVQVTLVATAR